jgi:hypothetical protein
MGLEVTITGTPEEFAARLRSQAADHASIARECAKEAKAKHNGIAEGLLMAAEDVARWRLPQQHGGTVTMTHVTGAGGSGPNGGVAPVTGGGGAGGGAVQRPAPSMP